MSIVLTQHQKSSSQKEIGHSASSEALEFIISCPKCRTLETVWLIEDRLLVPTRKFRQEGARIYHDCGSDAWCHLYRIR